MSETKDVWDENDLAEILACEPSTVEAAARNGELPGVKFGRSWRFPRTAVLEVLHQKALANKPKPSPQPRAVHKKPALRRVPPALPQV